MMSRSPIRVLFVCMANICRSPMAEAVFRHQVAAAGLADQFVIDSAGTSAYHMGEAPHRNTLAVLAQRGIDPGAQQSRQITVRDFDEFDYVVVMDDENMANVMRLRGQSKADISLLLDYAPELGLREVPDPYYVGGYPQVYHLVEAGCHGLLEAIREREGV